MDILWLRFSEEASLPPVFTEEEQRRFEQIYDPSDPASVWSSACVKLGLPKTRGHLLSWYKGVPYINWGEAVEAVSCGWLYVTRTKEGGYTYTPRTNIFTLFRLFASQWKIERYIDTTCRKPLPEDIADQLVESTALGLALQAVTQRLPAHTPQDFAGWMAAPDKAPFSVRKTMLQIREIQSRRTKLSPAWQRLFPNRSGRAPETPAFFWNEPPAEEVKPAPAAAPTDATEWKGLVVVAGQVTGRAVLVAHQDEFKKPDMGDLPILVFPRARPDTVELFPHAAGLLFAEGGTLAHACNVAREQGIPCVTGLGPEFFATLQERAGKQENLWLVMDGAAGSVKIMQK